MSNPEVLNTISEARRMIEIGEPLDEFLSSLAPSVRDQVLVAIQPGRSRVISTEPVSSAWVDSLPDGIWYHWQRLQALIQGRKGREVAESISAESERILRRMPDPNLQSFRGQGLVVGYVQSGKTANYTAVAARAVDAGYRLVIVLSGIHDSLRNQTQIRLEKELTGTRMEGVGQPAFGRRWVRLTREDQDFDGSSDSTVLQGDAPLLLVAKKCVPILNRLDAWLEEAGSELLHRTPVLLIDDEADQASINTRGNRPDGPSVDEDEEPVDEAGVAPSRTNDLIRRILGRLPRVCYIAYTATPFANILINPDTNDREVGPDLFPRDFVLQLPRPEGYTGTEELFGVEAQERNVLRIVPDEDVLLLRGPGSRRRTGEIRVPDPALPTSLSDSIDDFLIAGAIRCLRGLEGQPHTMLVHVSHRITDQHRIALAVQSYLDELRNQSHFTPTEFEQRIRQAWDRFRAGVAEPPPIEALLEQCKQVLSVLELLEMNSDSGEELDYENRPNRQVIAIGGNRLSRGLTLEGLTISYFLRTTSMCDTLLQMARWYGFRTGYEDLIRIWTTAGIARWFGELALVEQSLRDAINAMNRAGRRPDQMALRLRAHGDLLLTSRVKSRSIAEVQDSWSLDHPQTVLLPLRDPVSIQFNLRLADRFFSSFRFGPPANGGVLARDIDFEEVIQFLREYRFHPDIRAFDSEGICYWIQNRAENGELIDWSIFVATNGEGPEATIGQLTLNLSRRRRHGEESIGILIDPRHEGVDLPGGPDLYRRTARTFDAEAMRRARPATQGLLMVYPLDPHFLGLEGGEPIISLALSFPETGDEGGTWLLNRNVLERERGTGNA